MMTTNDPYHRGVNERLGGKKCRHHRHIVLRHTYVEVGLDKRILADWNVDRRVHSRMCVRGACIAENGKVVEVGEIPAGW
jgi:hypothetical protein